MSKVIGQFLILVILFFLSWFVLSKVDWKTSLGLNTISKSMEQKLADLYIELLVNNEQTIKSKKIDNIINKVLIQICSHNNISEDNYKIYIIEKDEINAFALPDGNIVIYSGLINECENIQELCGIIGHEIAHNELNHIMKKLIKEIGLSALTSMISGNSGSEMIKNSLNLLSSTAYDRELEKEADITSVNYLINANIDPVPFSNFLNRLPNKTEEYPNIIKWISTHPDSKERSLYILELAKNTEITEDSFLSDEEWDYMKNYVYENQ